MQPDAGDTDLPARLLDASLQGGEMKGFKLYAVQLHVSEHLVTSAVTQRQ